MKILALVFFLLIGFGGRASAMHPDSKKDFEYVNKYPTVRYVIKYLGDGTWTERVAAFPDRERVRWQVKCNKAQIRTAWWGKPYETKYMGGRGFEEKVDVWRGKPIKYIQYSCNGPNQFVRFWPAIPVTQIKAVEKPSGSSHQKCLGAADYKGCMEYHDKN